MPMMILFFRNADRILRAEKYRSVQKLVSPLLDLELVRIHSVCSEHYLTFLLQQCFNVKEISLGMMTEISDKVWSDVLAKNSLAKLEKISCQKCTKVCTFHIKNLRKFCEKCREKIVVGNLTLILGHYVWNRIVIGQL